MKMIIYIFSIFILFIATELIMIQNFEAEILLINSV